MTGSEDRLTPIVRLLLAAKRKFPALRTVEPQMLEKSLRAAWRQIAASAGADNHALAHAIAQDQGLEVARDLASPNQFALQLVPERLASEHLILPMRLEAGQLVVAVACPFDAEGLSRVRFVADRPVVVQVAPPEELVTAIGQSYAAIAEKQGEALGTLRWSNEGEPVQGAAAEQSAIVRLARSMLVQSIERRASDLHLQRFAGGGVARIRVDGILERLTFVPGPVFEAVVRYFKAVCGMDSTNDRIAQDGRMSLILGSRDFDCRLSVLPASRGERLVIRFLDQSRVYNLGGMGFSNAALQAMHRFSASRAGLVLVTGPTGSGKSSTLYSMLAAANRSGVNIITVEDPVEYRLAGVSQVEVDVKAGLTFAAALRSILRQDPDIVLVGEIRDRETAEIALQAALTGHLVFSTLHTNDAIGAIPRLLDLGVEPSILGDALIGITAQRLLRKLCELCRKPVHSPELDDEIAFHDIMGELPAYRPVGCGACNGTGYLGRFPVAEIIDVSPELGRSIAEGGDDLSKLRAASVGPLSSLSSGTALRIVSGDTTALEASRVMGKRFWADLAAARRIPVPASAIAVLSREEQTSRGFGVLYFSRIADERKAVAAAIEAARVTVHATDEPAEVRRLLQTEADIALLIVDVDAGRGKSGVALGQELRAAAAWARLPRLVIVREEDTAVRTILEEHGVEDYLVKPVTPEAIIARARSILAR